MAKDGKQYDRSAEDLGNIVGLEHVNLQVEDQGLTTLFYISGLGLTRDPYLMTSVDNMWVNVGHSQFHLITGKPQHLRGRTGLVIPDREALLQRLEKMKKPLEGTRFAFKEHDDHVETTCPWGNKLLIHEPGSFGRMQLGMPYVEFDVPAGSAKAIADFYRKVFETPAQRRREGRHAGGARLGRPLAGAGVPRDQVEAPRPMTAITSRSTSRTSRGRTSGCSSATSSPRRATSTSTASSRSPTWRAASTCSRSSTKCAA